MRRDISTDMKINIFNYKRRLHTAFYIKEDVWKDVHQNSNSG